MDKKFRTRRKFPNDYKFTGRETWQLPVASIPINDGHSLRPVKSRGEFLLRV